MPALLNARYPGENFAVENSEETLITMVGEHDLVILGRDIIAEDGAQLEAGTNLAVSSFIEEQLGVRWLWPGALGTDIPKNPTINLEQVTIRYTPTLHYRELKWQDFLRSQKKFDATISQQLAAYSDDLRAYATNKDQVVRDWLNDHRGDSAPTGGNINSLAGSMWMYKNGHAFNHWHRDYKDDHPEWFALQPNGTRNPYPAGYAKMCISNPEIAEEWVRIAKKYFEDNPHAITYPAGENDRGWEGYCVCEHCLAWDNKNAEILENPIRWEGKSKTHYALTDRYAKFWNIVARRLKDEFPERDVNVSLYAYHVNRPAPTIALEDNIIPAYVGIERRSYKKNSIEHTEEQLQVWSDWWDATGNQHNMFWRPNIIYRTFGLPYIFTKRHASTMRFLAEHGLAGVTLQDPGHHWAVQGPQLYLIAKLTWDPKADADAILEDYYQRAFGPAAPFIQDYFQLFEDLYSTLAEKYKDFAFHVYMGPPRLFRQVRLGDEPATERVGYEGIENHYTVENSAEALLAEATAAVADADAIYKERVAFVKIGFDFIQAQLDSIEANNIIRDSSNPTEADYQRARDAAARREAIMESQAGTFAINEFRIFNSIKASPQYFGAPD